MTVAVSPAGRLSDTASVSVVAPGPSFRSVSVSVARSGRWLEVPDCLLATAMVGMPVVDHTVVASLYPFFLHDALPISLTVAVFVTLETAVDATFTVSVMTG